MIEGKEVLARLVMTLMAVGGKLIGPRIIVRFWAEEERVREARFGGRAERLSSEVGEMARGDFRVGGWVEVKGVGVGIVGCRLEEEEAVLVLLCGGMIWGGSGHLLSRLRRWI